MRERLMACGATALGIVALAPGLALAAPGGGGPAGDRPPSVQRGGGTPVTEDSDGDGVRNCPDPVGDRDNRHPSGRDRHCESGSGIQGRSGSDPDGASNGGVDKPGGAGGVDVYDQDGNNGCGNDDDFEDDNRGRCLGRLKASEEASEAPRPAGLPQITPARVRTAQWRRQWERANPMPASVEPHAAAPGSRVPAGFATSSGAEVLGVAFTRGAAQPEAPTSPPLVVSVTEGPAGPGAVVAAASSGQTPAVALPFTGIAAVRLAALAAVLIGLGVAARAVSRFRAVSREG